MPASNPVINARFSRICCPVVVIAVPSQRVSPHWCPHIGVPALVQLHWFIRIRSAAAVQPKVVIAIFRCALLQIMRNRSQSVLPRQPAPRVRLLISAGRDLVHILGRKLYKCGIYGNKNAAQSVTVLLAALYWRIPIQGTFHAKSDTKADAEHRARPSRNLY